MKTKGIIIGTVGVVVIGCIAWGIKSLMDIVNDDLSEIVHYEVDYGCCNFSQLPRGYALKLRFYV